MTGRIASGDRGDIMEYETEDAESGAYGSVGDSEDGFGESKGEDGSSKEVGFESGCTFIFNDSSME